MEVVVTAEERAERLKKLIFEMGLKFKQVCGQRIYGPPINYRGKRPTKGCEVYVTNIPRDVCEDEMIRMFSEAGFLYQVKFMMEFSGMNRGFAYFMYLDQRSAMNAIDMFHGFVMKPGEKKLACYISLDNSKLYFEGLPTHLSVGKAVKIIKQLFPDSEKVTTFGNPKVPDENLGIGFVEFSTHRRAAEIRKNLWPSRIGLLGSNLFFEWAVPHPNFKEYHVLIVANLENTITTKAFSHFVLNQMKGQEYICNIIKRGSFATIQCLSRYDAIKCAEQLYGKHLQGYPLKVFVVVNDGTDHDNLMLFFQWAVYEERSVVCSALHDFLIDPQETIVKLAPCMSHYFRDTNALMTISKEKHEFSELPF